MLIDGHSYEAPTTIGATVSHKHRQCPASGMQTDTKARLCITLKEKHTYLWKCHHCGKAGKARAYTGQAIPQGAEVKAPNGCPPIPEDASYRLPIEAELWLQKAHITIERAKHYRIMYSHSQESLVLPIQAFSNGQPVGHILRRMGESAQTRYLSRLKAEKGLAGLKKGSSVCVLVEDWLSTIRLADLGYSAVCLLGTSCSKAGYWELVNTDYQTFVVWLDNDSELVRAKARSIQGTLLALGKEAILYTGREEPKLLLPEQLKGCLEALVLS